MRWSFDRTGFPLVELPQIGLAAQLWPATKMQFEQYLAEPDGPGDAWYESILSVAPRVSLVDANERNFEGMFLGGVVPEEAERFAAWLKNGFALPSMEQWRAVDRELNDSPLDADELAALRADSNLHPQARRLLDWFTTRLRPATWGELARLREGLLEWVTLGAGRFGGLGSTRPQFLAVIVNPQRDEPVTPVRPEERKPYFGFRLVRPLG